MQSFGLSEKLWRIVFGEEEMVDCRSHPVRRSVLLVEYMKDLLDPQPLGKFLVLKTQIRYLLLVFDFLEEL